ncbi:glycosyltransferase family 2 protein [Synechococcus sp. Cu2B8-bc1011]|uniref:glycosyltransferase family 2 protein n=1 Tax=Synechococcus sp. Cu2B8-bc1011 TaxID=3093725 RepID=UPI0039AFF79C
MEEYFISKATLNSSNIDLAIQSALSKSSGANGVFTFQITGNIWEPLCRWLRMDSRALSTTTISNRLSTWDIESLAEIHSLVPVKWVASKLTPFHTSWVPQKIKNALRRIPGIRDFAYSIEYTFRQTGQPNIDPVASIADTYSIVLPARNESGNEQLIRDALDHIICHLPNSEVIFVEGNSSDNTWIMLNSVVSDYQEKLRILLIKQEGRGKKNAVISGFSKATGSTLAIIDTDFTVDILDSIRAIEYSSRLNGCFINCTRTVYPMEEGAMRWANYIGNRVFATLVSCLLCQNVSDSLCGTKIFTKHLYASMLADGSWLSKTDPFGDFTVLFGASKYKYKIINYPVKYKSRFSGSPNISRWTDGLKLIRVCWHYFLSA